MKETIKARLSEMGFSLNNFDEDYELAIDNYNFEYNCDNAEDHDDFEIYCVDNWIEHSKSEQLAEMMNTDSSIPDTAIDEFEANPEGTLEKYKCSLKSAIEQCKKTGTGYEVTVDTEYLGHDNIVYKAKATLEIEPCGDWQVSLYDYYDPEKEKWIDTEERNEISEAEINNMFFA